MTRSARRVGGFLTGMDYGRGWSKTMLRERRDAIRKERTGDIMGAKRKEWTSTQ